MILESYVQDKFAIYVVLVWGLQDFKLHRVVFNFGITLDRPKAEIF